MNARDRPKIRFQALAPGTTTSINQGRIETVWAPVDPLQQGIAAFTCESALEPLSVFQNYNIPSQRFEDFLDPMVTAVLDHPVQALAVVINNPPYVAETVLPALEQSLV